MRPLIGVTTSFAEEEQRLERAYVLAIERAGGLPLPVPMLASDEAADAFVALLDGLVVTGGPCVARGLVGERPDDLAPTDPVREASDARLLGRFLDDGRPVLGICYGMQLASALRGGTIWADVERQVEGTAVHSLKRGGLPHPIRVEPGSHVAAALGPGGLTAPTRHVQAVHTPGAGLLVSARAPDGTIEALETTDGQFVGVQFHPESLGAATDGLFRHLVERARAGRAERRRAEAA